MFKGFFENEKLPAKWSCDQMEVLDWTFWVEDSVEHRARDFFVLIIIIGLRVFCFANRYFRWRWIRKQTRMSSCHYSFGTFSSLLQCVYICLSLYCRSRTSWPQFWTGDNLLLVHLKLINIDTLSYSLRNLRNKVLIFL